MSSPDITPDIEALDTPPRPTGAWSVIREALRGSHQDFTQGSVPRAIVLLAVPMVMEMALESVFAITDIFFVGRLGATAVATVALTESMLSIIYAVAMGLMMGVTALVARRIGERDPEGAAESAAQALFVGLVASVLLGAAGATLAPRLLAVMGADPDVIGTGVWFTRIMLGGSGCIVFLFLLNAIFRGAGDAAIAMRVLWFANAINIVLDPCLIFGLGPFPRLGVTGAAVATTIGRSAGALFALSRLIRPGGRVTVRPRHLHLNREVMGRLLRLSGSGAFQAFVGSASWIGIIRIMARFGSEMLAGYAISIRIVIFALLPSWGLGNAAATMVGQALGARQPERAASAVWLAAFYDCCVLGVIGLVFAIGARFLTSLFTSDPAVQATAATSLRIIALGFPLYAYGMVVTQSFNGAGDTWTPTLINIGVFWLWEIPLAYVLAVPLGFGPTGVYSALTIAFCTLAVVSILLFRRGRWKAIAL